MSNPVLHQAKWDAKIVRKKEKRPDDLVSENVNVGPMPPPDNRRGCAPLPDHCQSIKINRVKDKRMNKLIHKFVNEIPKITTKTHVIYKRILNDFIKFSSTISSMDLPNFIIHTFPYESFIKEGELYLKGWAVKYCNVITRFLEFNNKFVSMKIHKQYYAKSTSKNNKIKPKMTKKRYLMYTLLLHQRD